ncbi:hypothetical protein CKO28_16110 [Rhodovibrio sodomensis]|uniref:Flagellin C-terminal domain-containing protein n=1 Tax=Rhodovibrio sodomensis TaxID=1088 RepID=A0ABS1DGG9_9PROT|nr:hypothetical protein [Rhodovibrio sodomensis]
MVDAAQFNGSNLLKDASGTAKFDILSSLDRNSNQEVEASRISVDQVNLSTEDGALNSANNNNLNVDAANTVTFGLDNANAIAAGDLDTITITYNDANGETKTETLDVSQDDEAAIVTKLNGLDGGSGKFSAAASTATGFDVTTTADTTVNAISFTGKAVGLQSMGQIDVTSAEGAQNALQSMEGFTQQAIDAAANFGQAQMRVETQMDFVGKLTDSLTAGVGSLVDADMTEESAKLNALQVQQQLGTQALSIANQAPQALLSLFR